MCSMCDKHFTKKYLKMLLVLMFVFWRRLSLHGKTFICLAYDKLGYVSLGVTVLSFCWIWCLEGNLEGKSHQLCDVRLKSGRGKKCQERTNGSENQPTKKPTSQNPNKQGIQRTRTYDVEFESACFGICLVGPIWKPAAFCKF